jgi:hypothetical protein
MLVFLKLRADFSRGYARSAMQPSISATHPLTLHELSLAIPVAARVIEAISASLAPYLKPSR